MVEHGSELVKAVVVLAAGVIAAPIFKRLGLGSVLGYLAAGALALAAMSLKSASVYLVARLTKSPHAVALERSAMMTQGGEFSCVLYSAAAAAGVIEAPVHPALTAAVIVSMALTPLAVMALRCALPKSTGPDMQGVDPIVGAERYGESKAADRVLIIGFGRFGQIASQIMLARGVEVTIIENDTEMIRTATRFGFHAWYGDGTRMVVLHASGAHQARALLVCVDDKDATTRIVELAKKAFPLTPVLARAYDRQHAITLIKSGVDYQTRETLASAMVFGAEALRRLDVSEEEISEVTDDVRRRDAERLEMEITGGFERSRDLLHHSRWRAEPWTRPKREGQQLNEDAQAENPDALRNPQAARFITPAKMGDARPTTSALD